MAILRSDPRAFEGDEVIIYEDYETLKEMFSYQIRPTDTHREIIKQMEIYIRDNEKFQKNKNLAAARRARRALLTLFHLVRQRRREMVEVYKDPEFREYEFRK